MDRCRQRVATVFLYPAYWLFAIAFQFPKHLRDDLVCRLEVLYLKSFRKVIDPWHLQVHRIPERLHPLVRQYDKGRPSVVRIDFKRNEVLRRQVVDDALNILAVSSDIARKPRDRLRPFSCGDDAKNLPARTRQTNLADQTVSRRE